MNYLFFTWSILNITFYTILDSFLKNWKLPSKSTATLKVTLTKISPKPIFIFCFLTKSQVIQNTGAVLLSIKNHATFLYRLRSPTSRQQIHYKGASNNQSYNSLGHRQTHFIVLARMKSWIKREATNWYWSLEYVIQCPTKEAVVEIHDSTCRLP